MIQFLDIGGINRRHENYFKEAQDRVLRSGRFILGPECEKFEHEFAAYCGAKHCIGVGSGLSALELVLRAWEIGPGDEVIVPANTFIATWLAVSQVGARIVPVEPEIDSFNIDPERVEAAITPRTRAIIPVHLYGTPADTDALMNIGARHGIRVLEDAAQAHGATVGNRKAGALCDAAAFSFYPGKNLGALGDGGAVLSNDAAFADKVRSLRNYGSRAKYIHDEMGFNSRLDELQAAFLRIKLGCLDSDNDARRVTADKYWHGLSDLDPEIIRPPKMTPNSSWHLYVIRSAHRARLMQHLTQRGVGCMIHYPVPPYLQRAYSQLGYGEADFPITTSLSEEVLSIPIGPHLSANDIDFVIEQLRRFSDLI